MQEQEIFLFFAVFWWVVVFVSEYQGSLSGV